MAIRHLNYDLLDRLLSLYPVDHIKESFKSDERYQHEIRKDILSRFTQAEIYDYVVQDFNIAKQHIYFFELNKNFGRDSVDFDDFTFDTINIRNTQQGGVQGTYLVNVEHTGLSTEPMKKVEIDLLQPTRITAFKNYLIIQQVKLVKKIAHYFPNSENVVNVKKDFTEKDIIEEIISKFDSRYKVQMCDINRAIKDLWDADLIDARFSQNRDKDAVETQNMHKGKLLKRNRKDKYNAIIQNPLEEMIFENTGGDFCDHFLVNPSEGKLDIPTYPQNSKQVTNVINQILAGN